jgi:hypothetical protein
MADTDFQLQIYFKQLKRINIRLKLMEQLKKAPFIYVYSMKETIRRQNFSKIYKNVNLFIILIANIFFMLYYVIFHFLVCQIIKRINKSSF